MEELKNLTGEIRKIRPNVNVIVDGLSQQNFDFIEENIPRQLTNIRERLIKFVKGISQFRRSVATHMFVETGYNIMRCHSQVPCF